MSGAKVSVYKGGARHDFAIFILLFSTCSMLRGLFSFCLFSPPFASFSDLRPSCQRSGLKYRTTICSNLVKIPPEAAAGSGMSFSPGLFFPLPLSLLLLLLRVSLFFFFFGFFGTANLHTLCFFFPLQSESGTKLAS